MKKSEQPTQPLSQIASAILEERERDHDEVEEVPPVELGRAAHVQVAPRLHPLGDHLDDHLPQEDVQDREVERVRRAADA